MILNRIIPAMVCEEIPSPTHVSEERIEKLMCSNGQSFASLHPESQQLKTGKHLKVKLAILHF